MKKYFLLMSLLLASILVSADIVTRVDNFTDGESKFGFESVGDKQHSVLFDGESMVIQSKKGWYSVGTRLPVIARQNFKISYKLVLPKLDDERIFGLLFNYTEDENGNGVGDALYITEDKFYIADAEGNKLGKAERIKLKGGKNIEVTIDVEKKGKKVNVSINGIDFENVDLPVKTSYMGFCVNEKNTLKVAQIKITQNIEE